MQCTVQLLKKAHLDFDVIPKAASWLNVAGMICSVSMLITFFVLPVPRTSRHYLTVGLVVAVCLLQASGQVPHCIAGQLTVVVGLYHPPRSGSAAVPRCYYTKRYVL